jgi:hypothetical protein
MTREARLGRRRAATRSLSLLVRSADATDREAAPGASRAALPRAGVLMFAAIDAIAAFHLTMVM